MESYPPFSPPRANLEVKLHTQLEQEPIGKFLLLYFIVYVCVFLGVIFAPRISGNHINSMTFPIAVIAIVCIIKIVFKKRRGRYLSVTEYKKMVIGSIIIDLILQTIFFSIVFGIRLFINQKLSNFVTLFVIRSFFIGAGYFSSIPGFRVPWDNRSNEY